MQKIGPYVVIDTIGQGGMGVVYKAQDPVLDRIVAIKALHHSLLSEPEVVERFLREAKTLAKFSHQNIVTLYTALEEENRFYLVMEYVEGETVKSMIDEKGALPLEECISMFLQVLQGVGYAHQLQVIHRDIKPANIIITPEGRAKITDFGIAKVAGDVQLTKAGLQIGTLQYMPPEQLNGKNSTFSCDIYALGATFFEMLTGRVPFKADSQFEVMRLVESEPPPSLRSLAESIPEGVDQAILKALSKEPQDRFSSATEFAQAIESAMGLTGLVDRTSTIVTSVRRAADGATRTIQTAEETPTSKKRVVIPLIALVVCGAAVGTYFGLKEGTKKDEPLVLAPPRAIINDAAAPADSAARAPSSDKPAAAERPEKVSLSQPATSKDRTPSKATKAEPAEKPIEQPRKVAEAEKPRTDNIIIAHRDEKIPTVSHIEGRGWIRVMSYPKGVVFINQKEAGSTPLGKREVPVGRYEVVVRSGEAEQKKTVTVRENETVDVSFVFSRE
jgi:serine/threonine protein kinase